MSSIFLGSSSEFLDCVSSQKEVISKFKHKPEKFLCSHFERHELQIWSNNEIWKNLRSALDNISEFENNYRFAVFVLFPDDIATIRGRNHYIVRDNVLFEFGYFLSTLGKDRTFILFPSIKNPPISKPAISFRDPSDFQGVNRIFYDVNMNGSAKHSDWILGLKPAFSQINANINTEVKKFELLEYEHIKAKIEELTLGLKNATKKPHATGEYHIKKLMRALPDIIRYRSKFYQRTIAQDVADIGVILEDVEDVLDVDQLAIDQKNENISEVVVFAACPLEFTDSESKSINNIRDTIAEKVINQGARYIYLVDKTRAESPTTSIGILINHAKKLFPDYKNLEQAFHKSIEFHRLDSKFFLTYFTVHLNNMHKPIDTYLSAPKPKSRNKDILVKVDKDHSKLIISNILKMINRDSEIGPRVYNL